MTERNLKCIACGNCCPGRCKYKEGNLCNAHPSLIGEQAVINLRGQRCHIDPVEVLSWGYYCPPVAAAFKEETGIVFEPVSHMGTVVIVDWSKRYREEPGLRDKWLRFAHSAHQDTNLIQLKKNERSGIFRRLASMFAS